MLPLQLAASCWRFTLRVTPTHTPPPPLNLNKSPLKDELSRKYPSDQLVFSFSLLSRAEAGADDIDSKTGAERVSPERTDNEIMGDNSCALQVKRSCRYSAAGRLAENTTSLIQRSSTVTRLTYSHTHVDSEHVSVVCVTLHTHKSSSTYAS